MNLKKILLSLMIALTIAVAQIGAVSAQDSTPLTGTVQSITLETDSTTGVTTVVVTYTDDANATQTIRLSVDTAVSLGLVTLDPTTSEPVVNDSAIGTPVTIDPATVLPDPASETEAEHPVGSKLATFFSDLLGVDYDTIMEVHNDGVGFGVIAQALWMTNKLGGDTSTFQAIIEAKQSGDYSAVTLPDGSTPTNWGQFKKAVMDKGGKGNLGLIMSGKAENGQSNGAAPGNGQSNGKGSNGKGKGK
jgi:hypothetical protein